MDARKYQLFKTEMCRNWQEMGECRYAKKCRFAHGLDELRCTQRHARYKTEICKTFHLTGTCLYGVRCTFIHDEPTISSPSTTSSPTTTTMNSPVSGGSPKNNFFSTSSSSFHLPATPTSITPNIIHTQPTLFSSNFSLDDDLLQSWGAMSLMDPITIPSPKKDYSSSIWSSPITGRRYSSSSSSTSSYSSSSTSSAAAAALLFNTTTVPFII